MLGGRDKKGAFLNLSALELSALGADIQAIL